MKNELMSSFRHWVIAILVSVVVTWTLPATGQGAGLPSLSQEQQRLLRSLPASQREALARRYLGLTPQQEVPAPVLQMGDDTGLERGDPEAEEEEEEPVMGAGDTVVLVVTEGSGARLDPETEALLQELNARNPYLLDNRGQIVLPNIPPVALAGLSEEQAALRLNSEPALAGLLIEIFRLPLVDLVAPDLEYFGYDFFENTREPMAGASFLPVPRNYVVGPGDTMRVTLYGNATAIYDLQIDRDGVLTIPELGPVTVAGLTLEAMRELLNSRASNQLIGTQIGVTLDELRSVRVFLVGDVNAPGAYTVSPFATMTRVLNDGGGVAEQGSLRRIELKRNGRVVSRLDLYDLLLDGDVRHDKRIADNDVIFVPPVGGRVSMVGEVVRPAIYELNGALSVDEALRMAGGVTAAAIRRDIRLERLDPERGLSVIDVGGVASTLTLSAADTLVVPGEARQLDKAVALRGHIFQQGLKEWEPGIRLTDLLSSRRDLRPKADIDYVLIVRQDEPNGNIRVLSASLRDAWREPGGPADIELVARDEVTIFNLRESRELFLASVMETLKLQSAANAPLPVVRISGEVKFPGDYPLEPNMQVADLVRAAGGLTEAAFPETAELTRYDYTGQGRLESSVLDVPLSGILRVDRDDAGQVVLKSFDSLNVKRIPDWGEEISVELTGEVVFPGRYSIGRNERLSSVIERAGGLTEAAFAEGTVFTRRTLREREQEQITALTARMESDLAAMALSDPGQAEAVNLGRSLLTQLRSARPTGRLVIELAELLRGDEASDVLVRDGDALFIPKKSQEVTIIGEVQYPTSHLWQRGLIRDDYVKRSGGLTAKADRKRVYVVRANGEVVVGSRSQFFSRSTAVAIRPGDTVVVPINTDRVAPLVLWTNATQILYNLAIAAAAANSF